ncbi:IDEAL domain-containing protein [Bacillus alkalicellulosilyticus]|uniref:IDEAL domain-containing protein n=1 Tax=Alkalihalobacterium alkalicellulosilyticum TaxID=1912214 RepID=UPI0009982586|nr:IDEAL domain-containing protein [Bacillus alkalicellulosilyticus]
MFNYAMENTLRKQLKNLKTGPNPSLKTVYSLYAEAIVEYSVYHFEKQRYIKAIDKALERREEQAFRRLSQDYNVFLKQYQEGKLIRVQKLEWHLTFE